VVDVPRAFSVASLEDVIHPVEVLVSGGTPLVGIGLLIKFGYKAIINCRRKTVVLELAL